MKDFERAKELLRRQHKLELQLKECFATGRLLHAIRDSEQDQSRLALLASKIDQMRQELQMLQEEKVCAWRSEENDRYAELEERRSHLETKVRRLEAAALQVSMRDPPTARKTEDRAPTLVARSTLQQGTTWECAACGAEAEDCLAEDFMRYCLRCWKQWDYRSDDVATSLRTAVGRSAVEPQGQQRANQRCFWDERDITQSFAP